MSKQIAATQHFSRKVDVPVALEEAVVLQLKSALERNKKLTAKGWTND
jgi:hypothetical protein